MRLYYGYEEIKNLTVELSWQVDKINNNPSVSSDWKELGNEIDKLLTYYIAILNQLKPGETVTDFQMIQEFNETEMYIEKFRKIFK
ncbi:hypothetical protein SRRS_46170 [Sporomusa rhizae]|uniref:hypothetical protein n=1 Tax=Sporomusa rhizae TaxID=357999 RepID=UPI00352B456A